MPFFNRQIQENMLTHFAKSTKRNSKTNASETSRSAVEFGGKIGSKEDADSSQFEFDGKIKDDDYVRSSFKFGGKRESKDDISWRNARGWRERIEERKKNRQENRSELF
jgi:hypothetical protein